MRFNTPAEVVAYADRTAASDYANHKEFNVDPNPFCTDGARHDWQRGYDNAPPRSYDFPLNDDYNTIYQRGAAMRRIMEQESCVK